MITDAEFRRRAVASARKAGAASAAKRRKPCARCGGKATQYVYRLQVDPERRVRLCDDCADVTRVGNRR